MNLPKPMIILDRDGVINFDSPDYIKSPEEWCPIPGSLEAIADLNKAGYLVTIATNQSGVGRGYYNLATLEKIHQKMIQQLAWVGGHIDGIYFCPHKPDDCCHCRKPKPGMLLKIAEDFRIKLNEAILIGDSLRDIEAAQAVNCPALFVRQQEVTLNLEPSIPSFADLATAVAYILK